MTDQRRKWDRYKVPAGIGGIVFYIFSMYGTYTVRGEDIKGNKSVNEKQDVQIETINKKLEYEYVKEDQLDDKLEPLKQDITYIKEAIQRQETRQTRQEEINWKILKQLEYIGASSGTSHSGSVGGRALMRSTHEDTQ